MAVKHRITLGNIQLLEVDANPQGAVTAPKGSAAFDATNAKSYQNLDGSTQWQEVIGSAVGQMAVGVSLLPNVTNAKILDFKANILTQALTNPAPNSRALDFKTDIVSPSLTKP